MHSERKVSKGFYNNTQGNRLIGLPKTDSGTVHKQMLITAKLKTGKRGPNTDWERSIVEGKVRIGLRRRKREEENEKKRKE
jgi:hypothetical protein